MRFIITTITVLLSFASVNAQKNGEAEREWKDKLQENYDLYVRNVKYQKAHQPWIDLHFGLNNWVNNDLSLAEGNLQADVLRSWAWKFGAGGKYRLENTPLIFQYGLQFSVHRLGLTDNNALVKHANEVRIEPVDLDMVRSRFVVAYMNVPLMVHLDFSDYGIDNGFTVGIGAELGMRINGYQRQTFIDALGDEMTTTTKGDYYFQQWRYGLAIQLGYERYKLSAGYDLNPVFHSGPSPQMAYLLLGIVL